jgi:tRNA threonylcarbamoyladenosine biosynthesis protein TsaB
MPRALAIEISGKVGSVALADAGRVLDERHFEHGLQNAARILIVIDEMVRSAGWTPRGIEQIYLSTGPGSFTGLRIGTTIAKTLWLAIGSQIVAVPTVRVLAENAPRDASNVVIVLDAKRDQIFSARFERGTIGWIEREPAHLDSLSAVLLRSPRPVWLVGEGIPYHARFVPREDPSVHVTEAESWRGRASAVARIGFEMAARGEFVDPLQLTPLYVRLPEAEEKRLAAEAAAQRSLLGNPDVPTNLAK